MLLRVLAGFIYACGINSPSLHGTRNASGIQREEAQAQAASGRAACRYTGKNGGQGCTVVPKKVNIL